MALIQPSAGLAVLVALLAVGLMAWFWPRRRVRPGAALPFGAATRLRALPRFRALAAHRWRWSAVECGALLIAAAGIALLVARPVDQDAQAAQRSNRDVVLCMDVSGSMTPVVQETLASFERLAGDLDGERIGLVVFDSAAVTVFPLTDDGAYIQQHLADTAARLDGHSLPGTRLGSMGSSLIGDGLASCLQRFDDDDPDRSRTVVLATDNQTSGKSLFSLEEATELAQERGALVFGITPNDNAVAATEALTEQVRTTGGDTLFLAPGTPLEEISDSVQAAQRRELESPHRMDSKALVWPGLGLTVAGVVSAAVAHRRGTK